MLGRAVRFLLADFFDVVLPIIHRGLVVQQTSHCFLCHFLLRLSGKNGGTGWVIRRLLIVHLLLSLGDVCQRRATKSGSLVLALAIIFSEILPVSQPWSQSVVSTERLPFTNLVQQGRAELWLSIDSAAS